MFKKSNNFKEIFMTWSKSGFVSISFQCGFRIQICIKIKFILSSSIILINYHCHHDISRFSGLSLISGICLQLCSTTRGICSSWRVFSAQPAAINSSAAPLDQTAVEGKLYKMRRLGLPMLWSKFALNALIFSDFLVWIALWSEWIGAGVITPLIKWHVRFVIFVC